MCRSTGMTFSTASTTAWLPEEWRRRRRNSRPQPPNWDRGSHRGCGARRPACCQLQTKRSPRKFFRGLVCALRRCRHQECQNSASRIMIGSGTPRSQSSAPRPKPMASSFFQSLCLLDNARSGEQVPAPSRGEAQGQISSPARAEWQHPRSFRKCCIQTTGRQNARFN
jgi:hypothetical protein